LTKANSKAIREKTARLIRTLASSLNELIFLGLYALLGPLILACLLYPSSGLGNYVLCGPT